MVVIQSELDCVTLLTGALCLVSLLPVIPVTVVPLLGDIFEVFHRLVLYTHNKSGSYKPFISNQLYCSHHLQCFGTNGWASGRASGP